MSTPMVSLRKTALHDRHRQLGAKMTEFHGWDMPLYYTSILDEHRAVRETLGLFDISHMGQVLVTGKQAVQTLDRLMVSDMTQVGEGRACYTLMLNESGGIIDDLIIYRLGAIEFLVIVNCGNRETDVAWLKGHLQGDTAVTDISEGRSIIAVQGPRAARVLEETLDARVMSLGRFDIAPIRTMGPDACIARTGYTGSDGFELFLPNHHAVKLWDWVLSAAKAAGVRPIGLGARDTLRIEAGLRLYGTDMDATTSPVEAGLEWTVAYGKADFIGKPVLMKQKQEGVVRMLAGFKLEQGPMPRTGTELAVNGKKVGAVTSGTFSLMLQQPVGMGYVELACAKPGTVLTVTVRNQKYQATVVKMPFWKPSTKPAALSQAAPTTEQ